MKAPETQTIVKEQIPPGNYMARCYQLIDLGTIIEDFQGEPKTRRIIRFGWEFPTKTKVFKPENGPQPFVISRDMTWSVHEKATLRGVMESWIGKSMTDEEARDFEFLSFIGMPCLIQVIHNAKGYPVAKNITTVPEGMVVPPAVNPSFVLSYDAWSQEKFNSLPDFIKDKMKTSLEYKEMFEAQPMNHDRDILNGINHELAEDTYTSTDLPF
jgi:hypothetical protein